MLILSLDSAGPACGVCVERDGTVLAIAEERMERGQDQRLMPLVLDVMQQAGVDFHQLDRVAVTRGPGSFTGLRIGLAAARGIGLAANKPVLGIDRFSIYRAQFTEAHQDLLVVINSKRLELFCRFYPAKSDAQEPRMMTPAEIDALLQQHPDTLIVGDAQLAGSSVHGHREPEVITCAALAARAEVNDPTCLPQPLYLRAPDVTISPKATVIQESCRDS